jgi:hypothetical protein
MQGRSGHADANRGNYDQMMTKLRSLAGLAVLVCVVALYLPGAAPADVQPCANPDPVSTVDFHRVVPVGLQSLRVFTLNISHPVGMQLNAPADYLPQKAGIDDESQKGLNLTAPHAGPFVVQITWQEQYFDAIGDPQLCNASAAVQMFAVENTGVKLKPPKPLKLLYRLYRTRIRHYQTLVWSWKCTDNSDPAPISITLRYELKAKGKLSKKAKTATTTALDPCMSSGGAYIDAKLPKRTRLQASVGLNEILKQSEITIEIFRDGSFFRRGSPAVHLGVLVRQGSKTLISERYCAVVGDYSKESSNCSKQHF